MAVPKKKTSKSRKGNRRGSNGTFNANFPNVLVDKETGEYKLAHHIAKDGTYKGKKIIDKKLKKSTQAE
jgi:large subunit ribosomal protein L32